LTVVKLNGMKDQMLEICPAFLMSAASVLLKCCECAVQCVVCVFVNVLCLSPAAGPTVKPSVSLLPPSSLQISGDSAALLCLLSSYSPQGALVSWTLDGSEVTEGVLTSAESQQDGRYSRSSVLTLSKARWEEGELYVCRVTHDGAPHEVSFHKSSEC
jgi:immunoglobulin lambda-like polypeptide 1